MRARGDELVVGLGTNLGDREAHLTAALAALHADLAAPGSSLRASSVWETEPRLDEAQPPFLNMAAALVLDGQPTPEAVLALLLDLEARLGRTRDRLRPKGPRVIDLDLLAWGPRVVEAPGLTLPHPRLHERRFALAPLVELDPSWVHPHLNKTAAELLATCEDEGWVRQIGALKRSTAQR